MSLIAFEPHAVSVTEAAARGLPRLVRDAEMGEDVIVERRGRAVAAVVSMRHLDEIRRLEADELGIPDGEKRAPIVGRSNEGKPGTRKGRFGRQGKTKWGR